MIVLWFHIATWFIWISGIIFFSSLVIYFIKCKHSIAVKSPQQAMESTLPFTIFLLSQTMHNAFPSPSISIRHVSFQHIVYLHHTAPAAQSSSVCKCACWTSSLLLLLLQGGAYLWEGPRDIQALVRTAGVKSRRPGKGFGDLCLWTTEKDREERVMTCFWKEKDREERQKWPVSLNEEGQERKVKWPASWMTGKVRKDKGKWPVSLNEGDRREKGSDLSLWTKERDRGERVWPASMNEGKKQRGKGEVTCVSERRSRTGENGGSNP